jgi:uncharacterized protein (DUF885 family)
MSKVYEIADSYVQRIAEMDPLRATLRGIHGFDDRMSDFSPDAAGAVNALSLDTLGRLAETRPSSARDRIARECVEDQLKVGVRHYEAGEHLLGLNILSSVVQDIRKVFDLMPRDTEDAWRNIAARMRLIPQGLASYRLSLEEGVRLGKAVAARQVTGCIAQIETWTGKTGTPAFFDTLVDAYKKSTKNNSALEKDLETGAMTANAAYAELARYLKESYLPHARTTDAVGKERYELHSLSYNGIELDLKEVYEWGWEQVRWVDREMAATAQKIKAGASVEEVKLLLETDPARAIEGVEAFRQWMQDFQDRTIRELEGTHFDLAEPVKHIEAMIAPPGGPLAMYYTGPSEDFSRPGRTWYPTGGKTRFPIWGEVSVAYHEGVPGHHFQIATTRFLSDSLSRFQRLLAGSSGYAEGWALYAERLMAELGFLGNPEYYLGMLRAQALRSVRVVIDIGMHLELKIPTDQPFHPGETWRPELGLEFMRLKSHFPADFAESEIDRYLGMPGQAISYKVGEREWLRARDEAKRRLGFAFDLKAWHNKALQLGPMGLAQMRREMASA